MHLTHGAEPPHSAASSVANAWWSLQFYSRARARVSPTVSTLASNKEIKSFHVKYSQAITDLFLDPGIYSKAQQDAWAPLPRDYSKWQERLVQQLPDVAITNGQLSGFIYMDAQEGYIDWLYVHPDYQGQGIASLLFQHVLERAKALGLTTLSVDASKLLLPMMLRKGFRVVQRNEIRRHGDLLVNYSMVNDIFVL